MSPRTQTDRIISLEVRTDNVREDIKELRDDVQKLETSSRMLEVSQKIQIQQLERLIKAVDELSKTKLEPEIQPPSVDKRKLKKVGAALAAVAFTLYSAYAGFTELAKPSQSPSDRDGNKAAEK